MFTVEYSETVVEYYPNGLVYCLKHKAKSHCFYQNEQGQYHSFNDFPAVVHPDYVAWYSNGKLTKCLYGSGVGQGYYSPNSN